MFPKAYLPVEILFGEVVYLCKQPPATIACSRRPCCLRDKTERIFSLSDRTPRLLEHQFIWGGADWLACKSNNTGEDDIVDQLARVKP